jgi:hypothetical protein
MDTKEVLLLLGLVIEVLKDLVAWLGGLSQESPPDIAAVAGWLVNSFRG